MGKKRFSTLSLLWKIEKRNIKNNWKQFLAVIAIGAIAVTLLVGLFANAAVFERQVNTAYSEGNLADLWVTTNIPTLKGDIYLPVVQKAVGENNTVEERLYLPGRIDSHSVYGVIQSELGEVNVPYGECKYSEDNSNDYYCLLDYTMENTGSSEATTTYTLGQNISLTFALKDYKLSEAFPELNELSDPSYLNENKKNIILEDEIGVPLKVTGFIQYPENITRANYYSSCTLVSNKMFTEGLRTILEENYNAAGLAKLESILDEYLKILDQTGSINISKILNGEIVLRNQMLVKVNDGSDVDRLKYRIRQMFVKGQLEAGGERYSNILKIVTSRNEMPFYLTIDADLTQARQFTFVFPAVFFLVAFLVILTTLSQMVMKERGQIGTMKAIGLTKNQIYNHYIRTTWLLVGIGTLIGVICGPLIIPNILGQKYRLLYALPKAEYIFPFISATVTTLIFMGAAALVTYLVCRSEVRLKPAESMRAEQPGKDLTNAARNHKKNAKVTGLSVRMALRNIKFDKFKSAMVVLGVMGCTALLTCGYGIENTINYGISHDMIAYNNGDISINLSKSESGGDIENDFRAVLPEGAITLCEGYSQNITTFTTEKGINYDKILYVVEANNGESHLDLDFADDTIAIPVKYANEMGVKVGDTLSFNYNGKTCTSKVGQVYEAFVYNYVMIHASHPELADSSLSYSFVFVNIDESVISIDEAVKKIMTISYVSSTQTQEGWSENIKNVVGGILVMTNAIKVFAILLAIVVLYNLALMNYKQRTRDIATLKVLGFHKKEIALSLLIESLTLTLLGSVVGLIVGYPFMLAVMKTNIVNLVEYLYRIEIITYVISFALTFLVSVAINTYFSSMTRRVKMVESLKSVE